MIALIELQTTNTTVGSCIGNSKCHQDGTWDVIHYNRRPNDLKVRFSCIFL